jgi:hypothetical protein
MNKFNIQHRQQPTPAGGHHVDRSARVRRWRRCQACSRRMWASCVQRTSGADLRARIVHQALRRAVAWHEYIHNNTTLADTGNSVGRRARPAARRHGFSVRRGFACHRHRRAFGMQRAERVLPALPPTI